MNKKKNGNNKNSKSNKNKAKMNENKKNKNKKFFRSYSSAHSLHNHLPIEQASNNCAHKVPG